jgi:hypothetical protein
MTHHRILRVGSGFAVPVEFGGKVMIYKFVGSHYIFRSRSLAKWCRLDQRDADDWMG